MVINYLWNRNSFVAYVGHKKWGQEIGPGSSCIPAFVAAFVAEIHGILHLCNAYARNQLSVIVMTMSFMWVTFTYENSFADKVVRISKINKLSTVVWTYCIARLRIFAGVYVIGTIRYLNWSRLSGEVFREYTIF